MTIHIECVNFEANQSLEKEITEKLKKYFRNNRILRYLDVFVYKQKRKIRSIGIACHLSRETLFVNATEEDFENTLQKVIARLRNQLEKY